MLPFEPFELVTPMTWKLVPLTWTVWPTGSAPLNSSLTTVGPTTSTRLWFCTSALVNHEPSAIV